MLIVITGNTANGIFKIIYQVTISTITEIDGIGTIAAGHKLGQAQGLDNLGQVYLKMEQIDEALNRLANEDPLAARLIQLRYFAGLSIKEAAEAVGISRSTAYEH